MSGPLKNLTKFFVKIFQRRSSTKLPKQAVKAVTAIKPPWPPKDKRTHTGQQFEDDDYRMCRFVYHPKVVNPNFPLPFVCTPLNKAIYTKNKRLSCDGNGQHPKIFINMDKPNSIGYCSYCHTIYANSKDMPNY